MGEHELVWLKRAGKWSEAFTVLIEVIREFGMEEGVKWGWPCFMIDGKNVVLIHGFKDYFALLFFKGTLLPDPLGVLQNIGENTQAGRQMRFTSAEQISDATGDIKRYIEAAIAVEKSGAKPELKSTAEYTVPEELQAALESSAEFNAAFLALTPGRQRGYILFIAGTKQSATRTSRVEKCRPQIMAGKGLNE